MIETAAQIVVLPVSFSVILDAPNSGTLLCAYAEECLVPDARPQRAIYEVLERAGNLHCFAAYSGSPSGPLVGFVSLICAVMPHGARIGNIESIFVDPAYRATGAADLLLSSAERYAAGDGCDAVVATARVRSAFEKVLERRTGYAPTHSQHTKWLKREEAV